MPRKTGSDWRDLRMRLISAAVLIPVALVCIWLGGPVFLAMILLIVAGMAAESGALFGQSWRQWRGALYVAWPLVAVVAMLREGWQPALAVLMMAFIFGPALWALAWIVAFGGLSLLWLRGVPGGGVASILFVILVVMASDTCAYAAGRRFGGPKLAPSISPGKTRSGALGGLVGATTVGALVALVSGHGPVLGGACYGAVLGIAAQCGDLAESAMKRRIGVKDSGRSIPGHGGLLDRFDGLLAAAPLAALVSLAWPGGVFWSIGPRALFRAVTGLVSGG